MPKIAYEDWSPRRKSLAIVSIATAICSEYQQQGYDLTLRQLYYQFVARDYIANNQRSYDNLGATIDKARKAGYLDWDFIVDRTRNLQGFNTVEEPSELILESASRYHTDLWKEQETRIEVWVEKEALAGVVGRAALNWGIDYFSCRGYVSQSELHAAAQRHRRYQQAGQRVVVIHLGDHDPSGIDMTRDIEDRLFLFEANTTVQRIALNMDQIDEFNPPPNPAKLTDSRAEGYIERFGSSSWELDALDPKQLARLINEAVEEYVDIYAFAAAQQEQREGRDALVKLSNNWNLVEDTLRKI